MQAQNNQYNSEWMSKPQGIPGCPPGLEYLTQIDQVLIRQKKDCMEIFTGWEERNRYEIYNSLNQQFFFAQEESTCLMRQCCGPNRGFILHITDNYGQEVMRFRREFRCCVGASCCADSCNCAFEVMVETPSGEPLGKVRQGQYCCIPEYKIIDAQGNQILHVQGPLCVCDCCADFEIQTLDKSQTIGVVKKKWRGLATEMFTNANSFSINFPMDLDVKAKAVLMGAAFLIDFMFFEQQNNN
ncbi:phospholipid scramblase 1-like [Symsagittifera roscoffensis]|uniref:phospholipid scramblase 1-like n=1 Tax=Symsagittifera roscoffensis TaxID=84072 RepID=UPI00307CBA15